MSSIVKCLCPKKATPASYERALLASETAFTVNEIEALYDLYKIISSSIINDGLIHKEEFQLALFSNRSKKNLFADRLFDLFDIKRNGVIEFGEFVRSLSIFHPSTPVADKVDFVFRLYDLRHTGYIEREEVITLATQIFHVQSHFKSINQVLSHAFRTDFQSVSTVKLKEMVLAVLSESDLIISDDEVEAIVEKTIIDADFNCDGRIDPEEWKEFIARNPSLLKNMTLPLLREISQAFPNFVLNTEVRDSELQSNFFD